jgi:MFS transporter, SP family, galactose:H+ symporter
MQKNRIWSLAISLIVGLGGILYGYDIGVISGALNFINKEIPLSSGQVGIIVGAVLGGGLLGTLIAGPLADSRGRKFTIALSCVIFIMGIFAILTAHSFISLLTARLLLGVGVGIVAVAVPLYVAELAPPEERGKHVTFFQMYLTFGIVLAYIVDLILTPSGNWHAMFAVILVPAAILLISMLKLPESPRWLVSKMRDEKAMRSLMLTRSEIEAKMEMQTIKHSLRGTSTNWRELINPKIMTPFIIAISITILNQFTGINTFLQYAPNMLQESGMHSQIISMFGAMIIGGMNFICTVIAIGLVDRIGRRPLLITGTLGVGLTELFMAITSSTHVQHPWLQLAGLISFIVFFAIGPGVVVWLAISELLPTHIRSKGMAVCLFFSSLSGTLLASVFPMLVEKIHLSGLYFLCSAFTAVYFWIAVKYLPETKAQQLEDIQQNFTQMQAK